MRDRVRERAAHLRDAANAHDVAAASLEKHLGECDRLTESIAGIERRARPSWTTLRARVARLQGSPDDDAVRPTATREDQALGRVRATAVRSQGLARRRAAGPVMVSVDLGTPPAPRPPSSTDSPAGSR
jgi:hypothetical protein